MNGPEKRELEIFVQTNASLKRQQYEPIIKNLAAKKAKGIYQHALAVKLFRYMVDNADKMYFSGATQMYSTPKGQRVTTSTATRNAVADSLAWGFEQEYDRGSYDSLVPKKYQKNNPFLGQSGRGRRESRYDMHMYIYQVQAETNLRTTSYGPGLSPSGGYFTSDGQAIYKSLAPAKTEARKVAKGLGVRTRVVNKNSGQVYAQFSSAGKEIKSNPRGCRRNPTPEYEAEKITTFKRLPVGALFIFESEESMRFSGMARGPWVKVSARTYIHNEAGMYGKHLRVGSVNAKVIRRG